MDGCSGVGEPAVVATMYRQVCVAAREQEEAAGSPESLSGTCHHSEKSSQPLICLLKELARERQY